MYKALTHPIDSSPTAAGSARSNGPLFFDVETTTGVVRGMANTGISRTTVRCTAAGQLALLGGVAS
jgi:hypothetical protein